MENSETGRQLDFLALKARHRGLRQDFDEEFSIRMHRALSWLKRAEKERDDNDAGFIFYWISFNANYSIEQSSDNHLTEGQQFRKFFNLIIGLDPNNKIYEMVWQRFTQEIRSILNNEFIYASFWHVEEQTAKDSWRVGFEQSKTVVNKALVAENTVVILQILFSRLYTLRNQMVHGNATWNGKVNRQQVTDGFKLISNLQPLFLSIMMDNPNSDWGDLAYPMIDTA